MSAGDEGRAAVARTASLLAVAGLPLAVGISGAEYVTPTAAYDRRVRTRVWTIGSLVAIAALGLVARRILVVVRVEGSSMLPTYVDGDRLLALRPPVGRRVRIGDVVVVVAPAPIGATETETLVKRVSRLEPHRVFVAGDNSPSYDSSAFGPLARDAVIGRVLRLIPSPKERAFGRTAS